MFLQLSQFLRQVVQALLHFGTKPIDTLPPVVHPARIANEPHLGSVEGVKGQASAL